MAETTVGFDRKTHSRLAALAAEDRRTLIAEIAWLLDQEEIRRGRNIVTFTEEVACEGAAK